MSFHLRLKQGGIQPFINATTIKTAPKGAIDQQGHFLTRIIHAFAGSHEEAKEYLKLGFKLGFGGAATWPQALRLRKVFAALPLDAIVLETDSPDMAPAMHPYQRNSPLFLPDICAALAALKGIAPEELASASSNNSCNLFGWQQT